MSFEVHAGITRTGLAGKFRRQLVTGLLLGASLCFTLLAKAQAPLYLPADIPLDTGTIYKPLAPETSYAQTTRSIIEQLKRNHYSDIHFDDKFSGIMLDDYIKALDGARMYFTQADIDNFQKKYRTVLDDQLQKGDTNAGYDMYNLYAKRLEERLVYSLKTVEDPNATFDFTKDEYLELDREKVPWPADHAALNDLWRKQLKSSVLSLKVTGKTMDEIRDLLSKRYRNQLSQVLKINDLDVFQRYMDALTMSFDPHTEYYAPRAAENFNMSMRLSLEGIGAVLTTEDEYTKVVSIVTGGPADLEGELKPSRATSRSRM